MADNAPPKTAPTPRRNPAAGGSGDKASDVIAYYIRIERDAQAGASALYEESQTIYNGLMKSSKTRTGIDKVAGARRQRRALNRAAAHAEGLAKSMRAARVEWLKHFGDPSASDTRRNKGIDTTS